MLTSEQQRTFRSDGYLPIGQVSTVGKVAALKEEVIRLLGTPNGSGWVVPEDHLILAGGAVPDPAQEGHVRVALHLCHISQPFRAHALCTHVASMVRSIFDEDSVVLTSLLFNKPAHIGEALTLHQDLPYYPYLGDDDLVTCWMALDEIDTENGCLEYLPGSHRSRIPHRDTGLQQSMDIDPEKIDVSSAVLVPLKPGEGVLHHGLAVHRSAANTSERARMGLATLYVRASAKVSLDDFPYPVLTPQANVAW